jgi:hypothetical protein
MSHDPAGWQPDPTGRHDHRYWDGSRWTEHVADGGVASTDPYAPGPAAVPGPDEPTAVTAVAEGDTASYPTAGAPPPYVPPSPVAGTGADPRGRRGLFIGAGVLVIVVLAVAAFLALGDDDEPTEPLTDRSTDTTEPRDESTDGAGDGFGDGGLPEDGFEDGFEDLPEDFADGDMEEAIAEAYEQAFDLSEDKAKCLAERITEAFEDEGFDPEQAMGDVFGYLSDCDISMEELGAS